MLVPISQTTQHCIPEDRNCEGSALHCSALSFVIIRAVTLCCPVEICDTVGNILLSAFSAQKIEAVHSFKHISKFLPEYMAPHPRRCVLYSTR